MFNKRMGRGLKDKFRRGVALVLTLSMLVLVTAAVLAFFARVLANRMAEKGSASRVASEILVRSVEKAIVSDLVHEMESGSTITEVTSSSGSKHSILRPTSPQMMIPQKILSQGISSATAGKFSNLIKQSVSEKFSFTPATSGGHLDPLIRAIPVRTDLPSFNGRMVGLTRWNLPQLIGDGVDTSGFDQRTQLPEWVLVTREGIDHDLSIEEAKERESSNEKHVMGRFAYNIYQTGGLVDINTAGYPSTDGVENNLQVLKGTPSGIDLSQIPGIADAQNMNHLIEWRHGASKVGFSNSSTLLDWYPSFVLQYRLAKGFLKPWISSDDESDQSFLTRQDLIRYVQSGQSEISAKALPFLTTFSRDLDQPSYAPEKGRPTVQSNTSASNYSGNDHASYDDLCNPDFLTIRVASSFARNDGSMAVMGEPLVKKRFALNRLAWITYLGPSANRNQGDVDMKSLIDAGISAEFLKKGTAENIQAYFGLTWNADKKYWGYDHGMKGVGTVSGIGFLSQVRDAAKGREADFFELLKASINVGSLAKGATNPGGTADEKAAFSYDTKVDYQILQIGANIIDQFDADGYPTRIRFNDGSGVVEFRGSENIPYFYQVRDNVVISDMTSLATSVASGGSGVPAYPVASIQSVPGNALMNTGLYSSFYVPVVWNPYDLNSSLGNPRPSNLRVLADGARLDADGNPMTGYNSIACQSQFFLNGAAGALSSGRHYVYNYSTATTEIDTTVTPACYSRTNPSAKVTWKGDSAASASNTALTFGDNTGKLYREPTILTEANVPAGSNLALGSNNMLRTLYADPLLSSYWYNVGGIVGVMCKNAPDLTSGSGSANTNPSAKPFVGFYTGQGPVRWVTTKGGISYIVQTNVIENWITVPAGGANANTYRVQYYDGANWITYDEKYAPDFGGATKTLYLAANSLSYWLSTNPANGGNRAAGCSDPRSRNFGFHGNPGSNANGGGALDTYFPGWRVNFTQLPAKPTDAGTAAVSFYIDQQNHVLMSERYDENAGAGFRDGTNQKSLPYVGGWYPGYAAWGGSTSSYFRPGLLSQNNPSAMSNGFYTQAEIRRAQYYTDPDGVARRAMGAFVPTSNTSPATTPTGLPMARTGGAVGSGMTVDSKQSRSRPIILNRPFRSVGELSYVYSGVPWKNLSLSTPESGFSALTDVFCIQENERNDALCAGKVNLNSAPKEVLEAVFVNANKDSLNLSSYADIPPITLQEAGQLAELFAERTNSKDSGKGPLKNIADLVGRWNKSVNASQGGVDGSKSYMGFSSDLGTVFASNPYINNIQRFREAPIRALTDIGTARTWNLMVDLVLQTGSYPPQAQNFQQFNVEAEQHYWIHLAIDRFTGEVLDQQWEAVRD